MSDKKPYTAPQVFRVELNHEQAIISVCSTTSGSAMTGGANTRCVNGGCKKGGTGSSLAARPS